MRIKFGKKTKDKVVARAKNKARIRKKIMGTAERPRLVIYRSLAHMYAQIVDDAAGKTLISVSTLKSNMKSKSNKDAAKWVGAEVAKQALAKQIKNVVFDRSGFIYHGRVQAVADGAREAGLNF